MLNISVLCGQNHVYLYITHSLVNLVKIKLINIMKDDLFWAGYIIFELCMGLKLH